MRSSPYHPTKKYDYGLDWVMNQVVKKSIENKDDDFLLMCAGSRGTGKSSLMLHAYEAYDPTGASVEYIGLNPKDFAQAIKKATDDVFPRFCGNDEANVSKRDAIGKYNKDILDLYYSIRGLKIFHWWNNPSMEMIDKPFIQELIKGFIYIATKDTDRPRVYYYFTQDDLLRLWEDHGNLYLKTLDKHARDYAYYKGWFRPYKGKLWKPYLEMKKSRMKEKVHDFHLKYGRETMSMAEAGRRVGISRPTVKKYIGEMIKMKYEGVEEGVHYVDSPTGYGVTEKGVELLKGYAEEYAYSRK